MYTDSPMVASAPTGSGKTVIFELAIIRLLMQIGDKMASAKVVYGRQIPGGTCNLMWRVLRSHCSCGNSLGQSCNLMLTMSCIAPGAHVLVMTTYACTLHISLDTLHVQ